jgi:pimeloyl-ACP methyl ester carboxylesterase
VTGYYVARGETLALNADTRRWLRGSFVPLDDGVTHYELTGPEDGDLVLLLGSLTVPLFYWDAVIARLHHHGLRTLTYSAYGRGYSDRVAGPYDQELFVRQACDLLGVLGLSRPRHLVGSSMGAVTALALLGRTRDHTRSLSLLGPAGFTTGDPLPVRVATSKRFGPILGRRFGQQVLRGHLSHNVRTPDQIARITDMVCDSYRCEGSMWALLATLADYDLHNQQQLFTRAGQSGVPALLVWGDGDQVTPIHKLDEVTALLNPVRRRIFTDCGHMVPFEYPVETADELAAFFAGLP